MIKTFYVDKENMIELNKRLPQHNLRYDKNPVQKSGEYEVVLNGEAKDFAELERHITMIRRVTHSGTTATPKPDQSQSQKKDQDPFARSPFAKSPFGYGYTERPKGEESYEYYLNKEEIIRIQPLVGKYNLRFEQNPQRFHTGETLVILVGQKSDFIAFHKEAKISGGIMGSLEESLERIEEQTESVFEGIEKTLDRTMIQLENTLSSLFVGKKSKRF